MEIGIKSCSGDEKYEWPIEVWEMEIATKFLCILKYNI